MSKTERLFILLLALALASCSAKTVPIETNRMAEIQQLYESKQYDAVIAQLEPLLEKHPTDVKGHHTLIRCYAEKQQLEVVEEKYKQAVEKHPKIAALWFALGYVYYRQGGQQNDQAKLQEAVKTLEHALELDANIAMAHRVLGGMFLFQLEQKNFDRAIEELNTEIRLTPPSETLRIAQDCTWLGLAYIKKGMYENAVQAYQNALKLDAKVQGAEETLKKVEDVLEKLNAVRVNPEDAQTHYALGDAYFSLRDYFQAIVEYKKAIELGLKTDSVYVGLGVALFRMNSYPEAITALKDALKLNPENETARKLINYINAKKAVTDNPNNADTHFRLGEALSALRSYANAIGAYQRAIELGQQRIKNYRQLGIAYWRMDSYDEAIDAFESALKIEPKNREVQNWLRFVKAERVLKENPNDSDAYFEIGNVHYTDSNFDRAIEAYKKALELNTDFAQAREWIEKAQHAKNAAVLFDTGNKAYNRAEYQKALAAYKQAIEIFRSIGNRKGEATILGNIGAVYSDTSDYKKSLEYHQQALTIDKEIGDRKSEATILGNIGAVYSDTSDYKKSLEYHQQALTIDKEIGDRQGEVICLGNIGNVYSYKGNYKKALEYHQQALAIAEEIGDLKGEAANLGNIGNVYSDISDYKKALEYHQRALAIGQEIGDLKGEAIRLGNIGVVYADTGDYKKALEYYQQALKIHQEIGDLKGEATSLGNIGNVYSDTGDYKKALEYHHQALTIAKEIGDRQAEAANLGNIGLVYFGTGDYKKALEYYQQALKIHQEIGDLKGEAASLGNIGNVYSGTGDYKKALEYHQRALAIGQEIGDLKGEAIRLGNIGVVYADTGDYKKALEYHQQALTIAKEIGNRRVEGYALDNIGEVHLKLQEYPQALDYLNQALQLSRDIGIRPAEAYILGTLGETHLASKNFEQALQYSQAGLKLAQALGIPNAEWQCQFHIGEIAEEQEKPSEAIINYKQAVETIESMREKLKTKEMQAGFMRAENKTDVYERLIKLLIELGREEEALEYLERSKSETLREALGRMIPQVEDEKVRGKLEKLEQLENKVDATASRLVEAKSKEEVENLTKLLAETKGQVNQVMMDLEQNHPEIYQFLAVNYAAFDVIQQRIPPDTLLVEYCVLPEETYLFLITRDAFTLKSVKVNREQLNSWVLDYREGIQRLYDVSELSSKLYGILIEPVEAEIAAVKTVTIVPYGMLYYLPFHALERTTETGERQFLIQWKRVSYLTSSTLMDFVKLTTPSADTLAKPFVAFGNPDGTLEGAEKEVEMLKTIIPDATVYVLDAAKKQVFLATAGEYLIVHLATHGRLDEDPKISYLVFAPKGVGNLTVWEIAGLVELFRKHKSIVVLSACDTAIEGIKKEHRQGKAVMSLAGAFARAGSPTLIASLWKVSDESTQLLMTEFYRALKEGQGDILDALRHAQLKVMQTEGWDDEAGADISYAHPRYWAPFLLIGEWQQ